MMKVGKLCTMVCLFLSFSPGSFAGGKTVYNLQSQRGWSGYALLPPSWGICSGCTSLGPELKWTWAQQLSSPSMDHLATRSSYGGGNVRWGDGLWNNHPSG